MSKILPESKRRRGPGHPYGEGSVPGPVSVCGGGRERSVPRRSSNLDPFLVMRLWWNLRS